MHNYDEPALVARLAALDRHAKTAFAAACAQRLLPFFERYAAVVGRPDAAAKLGEVVAAAWDLSAGAERVDITSLQSEAEDLVPSDDGDWFLEVGYGQNSAAAAAYAVRTWLTDDAQEAAWAARQLYEFADYAVLSREPELKLRVPGDESSVQTSLLVQRVLEALARSLDEVESDSSRAALRAEAEADGRDWATELA